MSDLTEYYRVEREGRDGLARCDAAYEAVRKLIVEKNARDIQRVLSKVKVGEGVKL